MERERVCTPEEAGKLLNDLKTVWQELSKAERWEVRGLLHQVGSRENLAVEGRSMQTPQVNGAAAPKAKNPNRISLREWAEDNGYESVMEALEGECSDSVMTALCIHGCNVEPDGRCEHGCPSPLLAAGLI